MRRARLRSRGRIFRPARRLGAMLGALALGALAIAGCRRAAPPELTPAATLEVAITSHGDRMRASLYLTGDPEPRPVVVYLHGYPGPRHTADLADAVRRAGFQVVELQGRGLRGADGTFSFAHGLEDVAAALAWVRDRDTAARYRFDPRRVALVGHSYGGWQALMAAASEPAAVCVAALAPWDIGWAGARYGEHPEARAADLADFRATTRGTDPPVRADPEALVAEIAAQGASWDYLGRAAALGDRALLLVAATNDTPDEDGAMLDRLAAEVRGAGGGRVRRETFDDDHGFSAHRAELAALLTRWLASDCAATQPPAAAAAPPRAD